MTGSCVALRISPTRKTNSISTRISGSSSPARADTSSTLSAVSVSSTRYKSAPISGLYCASRRRQVRASGLQEAEVFLRAQARRLPREQILRQPGLFQDLLHAEAHSGEIVPVSSADQKICHAKPSFWPLFQIFRGDKTPIGLDPARLHHDDIDAERLQLHPQTVRQALHSVLRRVIPAAELRPDLPSHRGDVDDFLVVLLPHCRGDKPDEPCHAE